MKRTIFALVMIAVFASCEQGGTKTANKGKEAPADLNAVAIPLSVADSLIGNYHNYRLHQLHDSVETEASLGHSAFMLNANALREYLDQHPDYVTLNVYLAKSSSTPVDTDFTLVYIGARDSAGVNVEQPLMLPDHPDQTYMMDRSMPCPKCDRIRLYPGEEK